MPGCSPEIAHADGFSVLLDNQAFFQAASEALSEARHSILLLGWEFDPRTLLDPGDERPTTIGDLLNGLVRQRSELDVRILIWKANPAVSARVDFFPYRAPEFLDRRIHFQLDDAHPLGTCHHQKLLVIGDAVAFCSGDDFLPARWDLPSQCRFIPTLEAAERTGAAAEGQSSGGVSCGRDRGLLGSAATRMAA